MVTIESIIAKIESGALSDGYTAREDIRTETVSHIIVRRHGRKDCGYVRITETALARLVAS